MNTTPNFVFNQRNGKKDMILIPAPSGETAYPFTRARGDYTNKAGQEIASYGCYECRKANSRNSSGLPMVRVDKALKIFISDPNVHHICGDGLPISQLMGHQLKRLAKAELEAEISENTDHSEVYAASDPESARCDICGKIFSSRPNMKRHRILHKTGRKTVNRKKQINDIDDSLVSGANSTEVYPTTDGLSSLEFLLNSIPVSDEPVLPSQSSAPVDGKAEPVQPLQIKTEPSETLPQQSRKRKAIELGQNELSNSSIQLQLNQLLFSQNFDQNFDIGDRSTSIEEPAVVVAETSVENQSNLSDRVTPDSHRTGTSVAASVDFELNGKKNPEIKEEEQKLECTLCDITYKDSAMLLMHRGFHTLNDPFRCNLCGFKCKDRFDFNSHLIFGNHSITQCNLTS